MKNIIFSVLFLSTSAVACPDLSGSWKSCRSSTDPNWIVEGVSLEIHGSSPLEIRLTTQKPYSNEPIIVDGVERITSSMTPYGESRKSSVAECDGNSVVLDSRISIGGKPFAAIRTTMTLEEGRLIQEMAGVIGSNKNFQDRMICE